MEGGTTMSALLTELGTVVTQTLTWSADVADLIVSEPLFLVTTGVLLCGAAIGIVGRLLSKS